MTARNRLKIDVHNLQGELVDAQDRLEELTDDYARLATEAAEAEAAWKAAYHRRMVELVDSEAGIPRKDRTTVGERESLVMNATEDAHRLHLLRDAGLKANREALRTAQYRVDVVRTAIASERALMSWA